MIKFIQLFKDKKMFLALMGLAMILVTILGITPEAIAHGVTSGDKGYIQESTGVLPIPFIYLGAKHMMTGYDHLLFLFGVIFYLYRREDVAKYVTLFAVGHVITLLSGVLFKIGINAYIIDTIIGFSIVYKALDIIGLKKMGEIRVSLAKEESEQQAEAKPAQPEALAPANNAGIKQDETNAIAAPAPTQLAAGTLSHETQVTLAPDRGKEVKLDMSKGNKVQYAWASSGGKVNYDVHADSKKLKIDYHKYSKGAEQTKTGELVAAFDGSHGWFWRNRTNTPVTITLKTKGEYTEIIQ